jgi:hypothetical protein
LAEHDAQQQEREQRQQQEQATNTWRERLEGFRAKTADFDTALASVDHIILKPVVHQALMDSEVGPQLMYELARAPKELERIAKLSPLAAVRALGAFEAKITANAAPPPAQKATVSRAPEPIRPVGQGATTSTKSPDEMTMPEYKAWWAKNHPRRTG